MPQGFILTEITGIKNRHNKKSSGSGYFILPRKLFQPTASLYTLALSCDYFIYQAIFLSLLGCHEMIPVRIPFHLFFRSTAVLGQDTVQAAFAALYMLRHDSDIARRSLDAAAYRRLVYHDLGIGQRHPLSLRPPGKKEGTEACRQTDAQRAHITFDKLHGVIYGKAGRHGSARTVDIQLDIPFRILRLQVQKLRNNQLRRCIADFLSQKNNPIGQKL